MTAVYVCALPREISGETEARLMSGLPVYRREKAEKYMRGSDRALSAAAWRLMRLAVREAAGLDGFALTVLTDGLRKPYFAGCAGVHFNVSHCGNAVACAVSESPCGVDIEPLMAADAEIARRVMPSICGELAAMADGAERDGFYTRGWTETESVYKSGAAAGGGLREGYDVSRFRSGGYYIALCAKTRGAQARLIEIEFDRLITD